MLLSFYVLDDFSVKKKNWVHLTVVTVLPSTSVERCFVSCMRDFFGIGGQAMLMVPPFNAVTDPVSKEWTMFTRKIE